MEPSTARFTSSKCPPGQGLHNSCELPFGFIWTPLAPCQSTRIVGGEDSDTSLLRNQEKDEEADDYDPSSSLPPILCLTCLSYLNMYAEVDAATGQWTCPLCESTNALPPHALQSARLAPILSSPTIELRQSIVGVETATDTTTVVLALDANLPREEAHAIATMMQSILPQTLSETYRMHLGLIIFGENVAIYQLGVSGIASADVFCSHSGLTDEYLSQKSYLKTIRSSADLECLWTCLAAHYGAPSEDDDDGGENAGGSLTGEQARVAVDDNTSTRRSSSRQEMLRKRKEIRLRQQEAAAAVGGHDSFATGPQAPKSPWTAAREDPPWKQPLRCTGEAAQCAIDLASMVPVDPMPRTARIFLFTNGCPNFGLGSAVAAAAGEDAPYGQKQQQQSPTKYQHKAPLVVDSHELARSKEYFDVMAKSAAQGGVGFDVLCTGPTELGIPAYQALVEPSSGYVIAHDSFVTAHLTRNMNVLLNHTFMSGIYAESTENMNWIDGCIVDIRYAG
jgi:hypothetical protein